METSGAKSLYISCVVGIFYVTEIDIWAGFEPVSSTEKIIWADYEENFDSFKLKIGCRHTINCGLLY